MRTINKIIVHCSGTVDGTFESIKKFHIEERGWDDIGYHCLITTDGMPHDGRHLETVGAHCEGENNNSLGLCLVGIDRFTIKQVLTALNVIKVWMLKFKLSHLDIYCHNQFDSARRQGKTCPGFDISDFRAILTSNLIL